ncbi:helix-turn-helix domain-containing protein [Microbacterium sp. NPDC091662]|uniref:helix-turn-helix domain-containing protein n=1 Tax=Microbacterium sp. NPDC091662 TaxID=3364211 RepID=UPI00382B749D
MQHFTVDVEVARRGDLTPEQLDAAMDALADFAVSLGVTPRGHQAVRLTFPADTIVTAARTAAAVVEHAISGTIIRLDVMPEAEADERVGDVPVPELLSTPEAAEILRVSQQRVRQMVAEGKLAGHRVGERAIALVRSDVEARAARA